MVMKAITFLGRTRKQLQDFPAEARRVAGFELRSIQAGLEPTNWKPMKSIGDAVREIRISQGGQFRVIYVAKFEEAIYVLHAFQKKTQKTSKLDIDAAKTALKTISRGQR